MKDHRSRPVKGILLFGLLALAGCAQYPQSTFEVAGPVARRQLDLFNFTAALAIIIGLLVAGLTIYVLFRFRDRGEPGRAPQIRGHRKLQILWTVVPVLIVLYKAVPTVADAFFLANVPAGALEVKVVAHQWWWEFEYPELGITTANELHIPTGRPVALTVTSADVIHSFWVPRLGGKIDAIPGRKNIFWLQADQPDSYFGQCAELCGTAHAHMRMRVIAQAEVDFNAWTQQMQALAKAPVELTEPLALQGQDLFMQGKSCFACHTIAGTKAQGKVGPDLTGFALRSTLAAGELANHTEQLTRWLQNPAKIKPGSLMPNLQLSDAEIQQLVAFLQSQK